MILELLAYFCLTPALLDEKELRDITECTQRVSALVSDRLASIQESRLMGIVTYLFAWMLVLSVIVLGMTHRVVSGLGMDRREALIVSIQVAFVVFILGVALPEIIFMRHSFSRQQWRKSYVGFIWPLLALIFRGVFSACIWLLQQYARSKIRGALTVGIFGLLGLLLQIAAEFWQLLMT